MFAHLIRIVIQDFEYLKYIAYSPRGIFPNCISNNSMTVQYNVQNPISPKQACTGVKMIEDFVFDKSNYTYKQIRIVTEIRPLVKTLEDLYK